MSDDPSSKKPKTPKIPDGLPEGLTEEDIFAQTKVKTNSSFSIQDLKPAQDALQESPQESVDSFESLDELQLDHGQTAPVHEEQAVPSFDSVEMTKGAAAEQPLEFSADFNSEVNSDPSQGSEADGLPTEFNSPSESQNSPGQFAPEFSASIAHDETHAEDHQDHLNESHAEMQVSAPIEATPTQTMDSIKNYSESLNEKAPATAPLPFTLRIEGKLTAQEAEKLLDVLSREKMDIREVDLEPQFEAGRVLIPRISEYAGILLIQALRGISAKIYFQPSDIEPGTFSDSVAPNDFNENLNPKEAAPAADSIPVTQGDDLPQLGFFQVIDTLIVSGMLSTRSVEALNSNEFTTLTEALMRELKFKAFRRGARGITHLSIKLHPLTLPTDYRVTVTGTAVS